MIEEFCIRLFVYACKFHLQITTEVKFAMALISTSQHTEIYGGPSILILKQARSLCSTTLSFSHLSCFSETRDFTHYIQVFSLLQLVFRVLIKTVTTAHDIITQASYRNPKRLTFKEDMI